MPNPDDTPPLSPPSLEEVLSVLEADEQEWMTMSDEEFDRYLREGVEPLAWDA